MMSTKGAALSSALRRRQGQWAMGNALGRQDSAAYFVATVYMDWWSQARAVGQSSAPAASYAGPMEKHDNARINN